MATKLKTKRVKAELYSVTLNVNGKDYKSKGSDLLECIEKLKKPDFKIFKTKSYFIVRRGKLKAERTLNIPQMRRLFGNKTTRSIFVKNMNLILKYA